MMAMPIFRFIALPLILHIIIYRTRQKIYIGISQLIDKDQHQGIYPFACLR
jgi:hypothetical protein